MSETRNQTANPGASASAVWRISASYLALYDALRLLHADEHEVGEDEDYEAFLAGNFAGCASCKAAFILRAAGEGREYPAIDWSLYAEDFAASPLPGWLAVPSPPPLP